MLLLFDLAIAQTNFSCYRVVWAWSWIDIIDIWYVIIIWFSNWPYFILFL